jgi:hypothetical protein
MGRRKVNLRLGIKPLCITKLLRRRPREPPLRAKERKRR